MSWSEPELVAHARRAFRGSNSIVIIAIDPVGSKYPEPPLIVHDPLRTEKGQEGSIRPDFVIRFHGHLILIQAKDEWNDELDDDMQELQRFLEDDTRYEALELALTLRNEEIGELALGAMLPAESGYESDEDFLLFEVDEDGDVLVTTNSSELEELASNLNADMY